MAFGVLSGLIFNRFEDLFQHIAYLLLRLDVPQKVPHVGVEVDCKGGRLLYLHHTFVAVDR